MGKKRWMVIAAAVVLAMDIAGMRLANVHAQDGEIEDISRAADVAVNEENFPDEIFRNYVATLDEDGNGVLTQEEIDKVTVMEVSNNANLTDLTGIEYFTSLTDLNCRRTGITELDLHNNTSLEYLNCEVTKITKLDVSQNTAMQRLLCALTGITELDVSGNPKLKRLECENLQLEELDVSYNTALERLVCTNTKITGLDLSNNNVLGYLDCRGTKLAFFNFNSNVWDCSCPSTTEMELFITGDQFDITEKFPGMSADQMNLTSGASKNGNIISGYTLGTPIRYTYDCGTMKNGTRKTIDITLNLLGITINKELDMEYTGNSVALTKEDCNIEGSTADPTFIYYKRLTDGTWKKLDFAPVNVGDYKVVVGITGTTARFEKEFRISKAVPSYIAPENLTGVQGQKLADIALPDGFAWQDPADTLLKEAGEHTIKVVYTPKDSENFHTVSDIEVTVTVYPKAGVLNAAPAIHAEDKTLTVGDTFDARKDVTVSDAEDGDITERIEVVSNDVDTKKAGTYHVTYGVTDSGGASVTKKITVTVKEKAGSSGSSSGKDHTSESGSLSPNTGDPANVGLWVILLIFSGGTVAVIAGRKAE